MQRFWREHGIVVHVLFASDAGVTSSILNNGYWCEELEQRVEIEDKEAWAHAQAETRMTEQIQAFIARQSRE